MYLNANTSDRPNSSPLTTASPTVGELRRILADLPDDARVVLATYNQGTSATLWCGEVTLDKWHVEEYEVVDPLHPLAVGMPNCVTLYPE